MYSEGRDIGDMLASWEKDDAQYRVASGAGLQQPVQVATVMEHAPTAYRDHRKVVPLAKREYYQTLRAFVRDWTLAQKSYDDLGHHKALDTSASMDIRQVRDVKGQVRKGKKGRQGERQRQERQR